MGVCSLLQLTGTLLLLKALPSSSASVAGDRKSWFLTEEEGGARRAPAWLGWALNPRS